ncbi:MAG: DUF4147 domain-containing protein [Acidobacteriota bacterium]|nr:DUF4147 domain-containing protein [Acidobacteriota bacterium]
MAGAFMDTAGARVRDGLVAAPAGGGAVGPPLTFIAAAHPVPDAGSLAAGRRALALAAATGADECLVVLLSGGASAMLTAPAGDLSLDELRATNAALLRSGAEIHAINTVRKHLSAVKGGRLAAATAGAVRAFVASDVVGDDLTAIGSGPTVGDPTTYGEALAILRTAGGLAAYPSRVVAWLQRGVAGEVEETPKPGDPRLARTGAWIIGGRADALAGARAAALGLGYSVRVHELPVVGEAREAAVAHIGRALALATGLPRPLCVLSAGETTVHVTGHGRGGRNQEFALAALPLLDRFGGPVVVASVGTDGIDGPTDAAGAWVDGTTLARARAAGLAPPASFLADNNAYQFCSVLGNLVKTGPTDTNVGDLQVVLVG